MSPWVAVEMAESQMDDTRHGKRLAKLLNEVSERPVSSSPSACRGWGETVAAYRLLDNPRVGVAEILSGHRAATLERLRKQAVALLVQDTSFLNYGTHAIDAAVKLEDLRLPPSNQLEALKGDRKGQHSIRINEQWRICFVWRNGHAEQVEIVDYH